MDMIIMTLFLAALLGALLLYPRLAKKVLQTKLFGVGNMEKNIQTIAKEKLETFSKEEVSFHNKRDDCWIIVKDKIYNVTPYVEEHPGGDSILNHAGGDSTEGFFGPQHASRVFDMVDEFYIGNVQA